jgi:hypothetical protein
MSAVRDMIAKEASRITEEELQYTSKVAGANYSLGQLLATGAAAGLAGYAAKHYLGDAVSDQERAELEAKANQRALLGAGIGAAGALALRKPVQGIVAPDPDDMVYMNDEEFDDLWKQRRRSR